MLFCNFITSDYKQQYNNIRLENGEVFSLYLEYIDTQYCWLCNVVYKDYVINGIKMVNSLNLLNQFKNKLPFGLAVSLDDKTDPYFYNDFEIGRAMLYILNADEI